MQITIITVNEPIICRCLEQPCIAYCRWQ